MIRGWGFFVTLVALLFIPSHAQADTGNVIDIFVPNYGFEEYYDDGTVPGWTIEFAREYDRTGDEVQVVSTWATEGTFGLRIADPSPATFVSLKSFGLEAKPDWIYAATADAYIESGHAQIWIEFRDVVHNRISYVTRRYPGPGLSKLTVQGKAPEGTAFVTILLYSNIPNTGIVYYDNVQLRAWQ